MDEQIQAVEPQAEVEEQQPSNDYFAAKEGDELGAELEQRKNDFYADIHQSGAWQRMYLSYCTNYGHDLDNGSKTTDLSRGGEYGELVRMGVNHYANIARHILNLTTSQRPAPQPVATNTDNRSHEQAILAGGLLDYYSRDKRVERNLKIAAQHGVILGEGWIKEEWDQNIGKSYVADGGMARAEGDIRITNLTPIDVPRDLSKETNAEHDWLMARSFQNRHILKARLPEYADKIMGVPTKEKIQYLFQIGARKQKSDEIAVYEFFHRPCEALPQGRHAIFLDGGVILFEGPLPYDQIPMRRLAPDELIGTPHGHTPMFDLLCIQKAINALYSAVVTNQTTFGVQVIIAPKGHDLDYQMVARGLAFIEYDSKLGKPEAMNLTYTPAEVFNFIKQLEGVMETLSGINSTVRGNPEYSLKSGSALALVQSQAIQFTTGLQQSYAQLVEDVFTDILNILKKFAQTKRVVNIVGKHNQHMLREFSAEDISDINRVVVDSGSALSKTLSGRVQIAQDMLNNNLITNREEYLTLIDTGRLEPLIEGQQRELMLIRKENEMLSTGKPVRALAVDAHRMHIGEHRAVLAHPDMRDPANASMAKAALDHIMEHVQLLKNVDPNLLAMLGEQSLAVPPPPPEQAAGGTPAKGPGAAQGPAPQEMPQLPALEAKPPDPEFPKNPATGREWNPIDGGVLLDNGSTM